MVQVKLKLELKWRVRLPGYNIGFSFMFWKAVEALKMQSSIERDALLSLHHMVRIVTPTEQP